MLKSVLEQKHLAEVNRRITDAEQLISDMETRIHRSSLRGDSAILLSKQLRLMEELINTMKRYRQVYLHMLHDMDASQLKLDTPGADGKGQN